MFRPTPLAGMLTLFSSMLCLVGLRPIRRGLGDRKKYLFDRIVDYLMPGAIIAVASATVLESINGLSGLELFTEANCRTIQIVAIAAYWIRLAAEDIVTWGFPARGRIVRPVASQEQLMVFQWGALLAYLAMSVLVSEPFYGLSTPLFVIMGLTAVPWVLSFVEDRFPNSQVIYKWYTDLPFIFRLTLLTVANILLSALLIGDSSDYRQICSAYIVMTIPYTLADMVDLFGREGEGIPDSWPKRIAETSASVLFSLITLEILRFG
jgi:hypothetical protein